MNKSKIVTFLIILIVILVAVLLYVAGNKKTILNPTNISQNVSPLPAGSQTTSTSENTTSGANVGSEILGNKGDLVSLSITPGSTLHGNVSYAGSVKGGYFFEGNILINILDANKNVLKSSHTSAQTDWMTSGPVSFQGTIDLSGLPTGAAFFEIRNDNASGLPANDKIILIPIVIN